MTDSMNGSKNGSTNGSTNGSMSGSTKGELVEAMNVLTRRRANTADPQEKEAINAALLQLSGFVQDLDQASLLDAARIVAQSTDTLEQVVASARLGPFDHFLSDMQAVIERLQHEGAGLHATESLPPAPLQPGALPAALLPAAVAAAAPAPAAGDAPPRPNPSTQFADLADEYRAFFARCTLRPEFADNAAFYVSRIAKNRAVYEDVGGPLGIPWVFIAVVHGLECGFNFGTHLHNGDPLTARTVRVPAGRPASGAPPFTWRDSARDALMMKGLQHETQWTLPRLLYLWERYNGFGYRPLGVPTPYLWSFSNLYRSGKFVADHEFDPDAVSRQCGAAVILKAAIAQGVAQAPGG